MNEHARAEQLRARGLDKILHTGARNEYPRVFAHFDRLVAHEHFRPDLKSYVESCCRRPPPEHESRRLQREGLAA